MSIEEFGGIKVLGWFLANPSSEVHFKELCRSIELSPPSVKSYCEEFLRRGWLLEKRTANLRLFSLNNMSYVVKAMKRAYSLELLRKGRAELLAGEAISLALYGSRASGEYDEKSDFDFLVVGNREAVSRTKVAELEKRLGERVQVTVIPLSKWEKERGGPFGLSVLRNHALLKGAPL